MLVSKAQDSPNASASQAPGAGGQEVKQGADGGARVPSVSLPKGGGAIKGVGEKFAANSATGAGSMTVPLPVSPGRSGFGPQLTLSYDSGAGNGPFGFGWNLSLPSVTRKTDKGLPRYLDAEESDTFLLSGSEDLVPMLAESNGDWLPETLPTRTVGGEDYSVRRYRPRTEGLFARIERWTSLQTGESHWRSFTRDNVTSLYGTDDQSRVFAPAAASYPKRIFGWLIRQSYDDKGNAIIYEYAAEDGAGVDLSQASERNRDRTANRYLKRIRYGNRAPNRDAVWRATDAAQLPDDEWMFEVVFDYGEGHYEELAPDAALPEDAQHRFARASASSPQGSTWPVRPDSFSSHRAGFEVRTYRRCRRVMMFHRFPELGAEPCLVRAAEFDYADFDYSQPASVEAELAHHGSTRFASFIRAVVPSGFVRDEASAVTSLGGAAYVTYLKKSLPPLEFEYSRAEIQDDVRELEADSLVNLPTGPDGAGYQLVDLDGEGVSGVLTEQAGAWFYKPNLGGGRFGPVEMLATKPSLADLGGGHQQLLDLAGDGQLDLVSFAGNSPGFYERAEGEDWKPFRSFKRLPNVRWDDSNLRFVDLNGDGHADILLTEDDALTWYPSLAEDGFDAARSVPMPADEGRGPRLMLADAAQSIYLADMCGDGLTDLVRVRNGEVCYWPNLGYGRFGPKVTMDDAPWFDAPDQFQHARVRLADIDGSGTNDIIYLGREGARIYFNQSGNRWTGPRRLRQFPHVDNVASVSTADLLGNGTACLVWSSPLPGHARRPVRYIDLMGGRKPHLLVASVNNLGNETRVSYAPSTQFYLADKAAGRRWITRAPFPVHVVERVETFDRVSRNLFVTRYAYHHGYFDGFEREFRGFGMVEQWDTEEFAALDASGQFPTVTNVEESSHVPPQLTRTWFHTGVYMGREHVSDFFAGLEHEGGAGEYFREPGLNAAQARDLLLADTPLPEGLTVDEEREACRALRGSVLRKEVYALDRADWERHPYTVAEQSFAVRLLQPKGANRHAVFFAHARESVNYYYERDPSDPRSTHTLTLEVDEFGNVLKEATVGYGRRQQVVVLDAQGDASQVPNPGLAELEPLDQGRQATTLVTYTERGFTNAVGSDDDYRTPMPAESRTYELTGYQPTGPAGRFLSSDLVSPKAGSPDEFEHVFDSELKYEETPGVGRERRLIEHARTLYRADGLSGPLPLYELQTLALPFEQYKLTLTAGLLASVYEGRATDAMLETDGRYVHSEGDADWWVPSGRTFYSPGTDDTPQQELAHARAHFFLPHRSRDPFHTGQLGTENFVTYDAHDLLPVETRNALGNRVTVGERDALGNLAAEANDYRVLQPRLVMDANRNCAAVAFNALGMVAGTAAMGKPEESPRPGDAFDASFRPDLTRAETEQFFADPKGPAATSLLGGATTRIVYDLTCHWREPDPEKKPPVYAATLARETHASEPNPPGGRKLRVGFSYSDGFGREIQQKSQAEPGPVPERDADGQIVTVGGQPLMTPGDFAPRWVGTGWTVFNNKGKAVRRYEPFFTDTHRFEFDARIGVSPVLCYDPAGRAVATLYPDHTWEKTVFGPWRQETWNATDNVLAADPTADSDVGDFFARLPVEDYLPTWNGQRAAGALGPHEQAAAQKTAVHAATPAVMHLDPLGRVFLNVEHNRYKLGDAPPADPPSEEFYRTRTLFDVEGNRLEVRDAVVQANDVRGRLVVRYDYDIVGNRVRQSSMEAGERSTLNDVAGKPVYAWDSRGQQFRTAYDQLRRPAETYLSEGGGPELLVGRIVYGEALPDPETANLRGRAFQLFEQAGTLLTDDYDFKGNLRRSIRQLAREYKATLDWSAPVALEAETYTTLTSHDALNRPTELTTPDGSVVRPVYNEANMLEAVAVNLRGSADATAFVTDIDYDAKGQRTRIDYGNGVRTTYEYDPLTFRLVRLLTRRDSTAYPDDCPQPPPAGWPGCRVQDLRYTYDPAGNVTHIEDGAQQAVYFRNRRVEPSADYTYDALHRLIEATGREHLGQSGGQPNAPAPPDAFDAFRTRLDHPGDGNALGIYAEQYVYDAVGNLLTLQHRGSDPAHPGWARQYAYEEPSQLEPAKLSNRLSSTTIGQDTETYGYDGPAGPHGNITRMPHLPLMLWDYRDQLHATARQIVNSGTPETTWYAYDSTGRRVRKVTERQAVAGQTPTRAKERVYLGGFEIYREFAADGATVTLERETLHVTDDKQRVALVETRTAGVDDSPPTLVRYQLGNHLGSASLELDGEARVISYEEYTPYGSTSYQAVRGQTETPKRYRFTGKERDEESGLYYHGVRYYACWLGRWLSPDPAGMVDGSNLYAYAKCNPLVLVDTHGTESESPALTYYSVVIPAAVRAAKSEKLSMNAAKLLIMWGRGEQGYIQTDDVTKKVTTYNPDEHHGRLLNSQPTQTEIDKLCPNYAQARCDVTPAGSDVKGPFIYNLDQVIHHATATTPKVTGPSAHFGFGDTYSMYVSSLRRIANKKLDKDTITPNYSWINDRLKDPSTTPDAFFTPSLDVWSEKGYSKRFHDPDPKKDVIKNAEFEIPKYLPQVISKNERIIQQERENIQGMQMDIAKLEAENKNLEEGGVNNEEVNKSISSNLSKIEAIKGSIDRSQLVIDAKVKENEALREFQLSLSPPKKK
jgi:RHS repeat-associated protein